MMMMVIMAMMMRMMMMMKWRPLLPAASFTWHPQSISCKHWAAFKNQQHHHHHHYRHHPHHHPCHSRLDRMRFLHLKEKVIDSNSDQNAITWERFKEIWHLFHFSCDAPMIHPSMKTSGEVLNQNQIFLGTNIKIWISCQYQNQIFFITNIKIRVRYVLFKLKVEKIVITLSYDQLF